MKLQTKLLFTGVLGLLFASCSDNDPIADTQTVSKTEIAENYANIVYQTYLDSHTTAVELKNTISTFTATPTEANFTAAKNSWLAAREKYGQTEAFRFASGPIDDADGPEGLINAWPLDENYIDYVQGASNSGIINDTQTYTTITKSLLESLNESGGKKNISIGYHAIEFLLWGQDLTTPEELKAGQRKYTDYVITTTGSKGQTVEPQNQARRAQYLNICADLLVDHLQLMLDEWKVGGAYRTTFLALDPQIALKNMLTGISVLSKSELAVERIFVAYDNQDQEDEHSCFSDNTHRDIRLNLAGIKNVYTGQYGSITGVSIQDLITETNSILGNEITSLLNNAVVDVDATAIPFDFAISNTQKRLDISKSINSLRTLGDKLIIGAKELNIIVKTE